MDFTRFRRHKSTSGSKLLERQRAQLVKEIQTTEERLCNRSLNTFPADRALNKLIVLATKIEILAAKLGGFNQSLQQL